MKSFPYLPLVLGGICVASLFTGLTGCGTALGNLKPGPEIPVTATPTFSPAAGTFNLPQTVTISDATAGATIYYTTDGSIPTILSPVYTGPIFVQTTKTLSAIAAATGDVQSQIGYGTFTISVPLPSYTFQNVTIVGGGFVDGVFFHPQQKGLMYARTDVGGAYRYLAGTDTQWTPLTDFIGAGTLLGVESLGLDPSDPQRLYLAMGEYDSSTSQNGEFELSDNQGSTFTEVNAPFKMGANENGRFSGERFGVDPLLGTNIWYGSRDSGLYESTDRGMTWTQVTSFPVTGTTGSTTDPGAGVIFEAFVPSSGTASGGGTKTFYVGVSDPGNGSSDLYSGLYVTNDGGNTFQPVSGQPTGQYPNSYWLSTTDGNLYITYSLDTPCSSNCTSVGPQGVTEGSVWKYTLPTSGNPSGTWTNITPPNPSNLSYGYSSVTVDPNTPTTIMVTTLDHYSPAPGDDIYRSTDGGMTWESIESTAVRNSSLSPWVNFGQPTPGPGNWLNHLVVDPFNSAHAMYGDGQTIWQTTNITAADGVTTSPGTIVPANPTNWSIGAVGIENSVVTGLISPPAVTTGSMPPNELISTIGDIGGFSMPESVVVSGQSPANGADMNPLLSSGTGVDYAGQEPLTLARVGTQSGGGTQLGGYSTDGGQTWTPFASNPTGVVIGGGSIAVSADGSTFVWVPSDGGLQAFYSTDDGTTWNICSGTPTQSSGSPQILVYADRNDAMNFYILNPSNGSVFESTDEGQAFSQTGTLQNAVNLAVSPAAAGDVWAATSSGLFESVDGANTFTQIGQVTSPAVVNQVAQVLALGFGATDTALLSTYPTIYLSGYVEQTTINQQNQQQISAVNGVFRSIDQGVTWVMINSTAEEWGGVYQITGDPNIFARVYLGTSGRGIIYGDSPN